MRTLLRPGSLQNHSNWIRRNVKSDNLCPISLPLAFQQEKKPRINLIIGNNGLYHWD